ncbi:hypothetical protein LOD99_14724 [Oopsacas minuta]|uniref:Uncharacterized protein n=1 Tax=Oopsacas minuta TaxID=111878 RepID=A0AAV7KDU7_9METZ|nr:hypothetical protein LOD99_14724 [Oopsacas minuta]
MASNLSSEELAQFAYSMEDVLSPALLQRLEERVHLAKEDINKKKELIREGLSELRVMLDKKEIELISYLESISDKIDQTVSDTKENIRLVEIGKREISTKFEQTENSKETNSIFHLIESNLNSLKYSILMLPEVHISWNEEPEFETFLRQLCRIEINQHAYTFRNSPTMSIHGKRENAMFSYPMGLALRKDNGQIFIADHLSDEVKVFNRNGELLNTLVDNDMKRPCSIELYKNTVNIVCDNSIINFSTDSMEKLHSIKTTQSLRGIAIDIVNEEIYICERYVIRINVYDVSLELIRSFNLDIDFTMEPDAIRVRDMKLVNKELYVLFAEASVILKTFNLKGVPLRSILYKDQIQESYFFTMDPWTNILVGDSRTGSVLVCANDGFELGEIEPNILKDTPKWLPQGLALDKDFNLIVVSDNEINSMQSF